MLKKHVDKLNGESYSIGVSKHLPNDSVNLAFLAAPEITREDVSIIQENVGIDTKEQYSEKENLHYVKNNSSFITEVQDQDILITDEFSIKKYSDDIPEPLFYKASLKKTMKGSRFLTSNKFVPYYHGYSLLTEEEIRTENTSDMKDDIMPLVYKETFENGRNNILNITDNTGNIHNGFKIRMIRLHDDNYSVEIYNNFDQDKIYKVTYIDSNGTLTTEVMESILLFSRVSYEEFQNKLALNDYWSEKEYALRQEGKAYKVFAPTQMIKITDENRKPFEFKYRVLANLRQSYSKATPVILKIGMIYLNSNGLEDIHGALVSFNESIGSILPDYISFINPHPVLKYSDQREEYKRAVDYWDADLSAPQDTINDYDILFITGYGSHDISTYNEKLKNYLTSGGKIIIDNASNDPAALLKISFGNDDPIIRYTMEPSSQPNIRNFDSVSGYTERYYTLDISALPYVGYINEEEDALTPFVILNDGAQAEDLTEWRKIVSYSNGDGISIAEKTYQKRGKILLSNCGFLKGFVVGNQIQSGKFVANTIITLSEDKWVTTPWIYDRVYHKSQIYKHEYTLDKYVSDINPLGNSQIVAKKILMPKVEEGVSYYTGIYSNSGSYFVEAEERLSNGIFGPITNIYLPSITGSPLVPGMPLYVFARNTTNTNFSISNNIKTTDGDGNDIYFDTSNVYPYPSQVSFYATITPFTFKWSRKLDDQGNETNELEQKLITPSAINRAKIKFTINRDDGYINLGLFSTLIPPLPSGPDWANKTNVFFKVEVSSENEIPGNFINPIENRVNLFVYDKFSGEYLYSSDGYTIVPYATLYEWRVTHKYDGRSIIHQKYNDIILQAYTNYYELVASKRVYAVTNNATRSNLVSLPPSLNPNESWFPRIRYLNFTKTSFNKEDYDRISKTIGFRYDKEYLLNKASEYFDIDLENIPGGTDDLALGVIKRLNNNDIVDIDDLAILSEAFEIMEEETTFEYDIVEYDRQPWIEKPYKEIKEERAVYMDSRTIKVQYTPMKIETDMLVEGEVLQRLAPTLYRAQYGNWLPSKGTMIQEKIKGSEAWGTVNGGYIIDHANGIISFNVPPSETIRASYSHSNISIIRKKYINSKASKERLTKLQDKVYVPRNVMNKRIAKTPNPQIFIEDINGESRVLMPNLYTVDYDTGIVTTKEFVTGRLYMTYSYSSIEYIEIKDYDARHGILELDRAVHFNDNIYVSYTFREDFNEYRGYYDREYIDPITNVKGKYIHLDMNPTRGHVSTYPVVKDGVVIYQEVPTYELLGKTLYLYMLPHRIIRGDTIIEEDITLRHTFSLEEFRLLQVAHPELISLGSIKIVNNYSTYDTSALDVRRRGGGLKEDISNEKIAKTDELSLNLWDVTPFDGRSFHPNGLTIIKLPNNILTENGGKFTPDEVEDIVYKHLALGISPIIKYYQTEA